MLVPSDPFKVRDEWEQCERGTAGCGVWHDYDVTGEAGCGTW